MEFQSAKAVVRGLYAALDRAEPEAVGAILAAYVTPDWHWRGMHPFHEITGAAAVAERFWVPFLNAFHHVHRREDVFMAGRNEIDGFASTWVCSMGHLVGLFDRPWLGIRPQRRMAFLRYAEFHRIEGDRIAETAMFFDLVHLMQQVGQDPLPRQTGGHSIQPGPMTHHGVMLESQDPDQGVATLELINTMMRWMGRARYGEPMTPQQELSQTWSDRMVWWGPGGIGATYTIDRYIEQHANPFRDGLTDYRFNGHISRFAEGDFGGFFGWPNLTLRPQGGFLGLPSTGAPVDMRVVDIYRRDGDKLAENWVFIDILHFLNMQGLDVLGRMETLSA